MKKTFTAKVHCNNFWEKVFGNEHCFKVCHWTKRIQSKSGYGQTQSNIWSETCVSSDEWYRRDQAYLDSGHHQAHHGFRRSQRASSADTWRHVTIAEMKSTNASTLAKRQNAPLYVHLHAAGQYHARWRKHVAASERWRESQTIINVSRILYLLAARSD